MIIHDDCLTAMAGMEPDSVDAIVTDPPYGLEFMGKEWDRLDRDGPASFVQTEKVAKQMVRRDAAYAGRDFPKASPYADKPRWGTVTPQGWSRMQAWHQRWAEAAYRVAKPSAYLLAFGGTRTVHRLTVAFEDAGWIIRDMLVWAYASGFPKSKASLKPAWEPIVMARKPGPLRMLAIDECRIPADGERVMRDFDSQKSTTGEQTYGNFPNKPTGVWENTAGRWPANVILTDPIFDGGVDGVVGGGETASGSGAKSNRLDESWEGGALRPLDTSWDGDSGTYSRFFLIPKADRGDREPVLHASSIGAVPDVGRSAGTARRESTTNLRANHHPTVKPTDLMRHLVRLVTPAGGTVLDPFLGSGSTGLACELEGFPWIGIEKEAEYVAIAEARLNGTQRGLGLVG